MKLFFLLSLFLTLTAKIVTGQITAVNVPGDFSVGSTLTPTITGSATAGNHIDYEWFYSPSGSSIGTGGNYTIQSADQGLNIYVKAIENSDADHTEIVNFQSTPHRVNSFPVATGVSVSGSPRSGFALTANYTYSDADSDDEAPPVYKWYRGISLTDPAPAEISLATSQIYTLTNSDIGYYIGFSITPNALDGSTPGQTVKSSLVGPVINPGVQISGPLNVGSVLSCILIGIPESGNHIDYEWFYSSGVSIASTAVYTVLPADQGKTIYVIATENANGTHAVVATFPSSSVVINSYPTAAYVAVTGSPRVGMTLSSIYTYSDTDSDSEGATVYEWYKAASSGGAGSTLITSATARSFQLTTAESGLYIGFSVKPYASIGSNPGATVATPVWIGPVLANSAPSATIGAITGVLNAGSALTGHYTYSDTEGDNESGSSYQWYIGNLSTGPFSIISGATGIVHIIDPLEQGKYFRFNVTPRASSGTVNGTEVFSTGYGPSNRQPVGSLPVITGTAAIGNTITAGFNYNDPDGDPAGLHKYRWFRDGVLIFGEVGSTYLITNEDEGSKLSFEVIPVSSTGKPSEGSPVVSLEVTVPLSGTLPVAAQLCIQGSRILGNELEGKYVFEYTPKEDHSVYRWMRNNDTIPGATSLKYVLTALDMDKDIFFVVIPYAKSGKKGLAAKSSALAMINLGADSYSIADPPVLLSANVAGGIFSGNGVSAGYFTPANAGTAGSPHTIAYSLTIVNTDKTCSQSATDEISILPINSFFSGFNNVYCHDIVLDTITVMNVPAGATSKTFKLTNLAGFVKFIGDQSIVINPSKMRPGNKVDSLYFTYTDGGSKFPISRPFVIDSIGKSMALVNLDPEYCEGSVKRYITVEGTYPGGGTGTWTGSLITDKASTSAFINPAMGTPSGSPYTVTYQYTSPMGCKSIILNPQVTINPLPNSQFTLNPTYNFEGGPKNLAPVVPGGNFVGAGVTGSQFYPAIAGEGTFEIKYILTDAKGCSSVTPKNTEVRKVMGVFSNPPAIVCYRDTTYNISVTGLPGSGCVISDFKNFKNSLIYSGGTSAVYKITEAGAGYDTLKFSYKWDGVDYTLVKPIFIDSIGKIAITGLKEDYCDYEGTASLRVFVENSTGNGNFSFTGPVEAFTNYGNLADFFPSKTPTSATPYKVRYTHVSTVNSSGCRKKADLFVTVNKSPVINITTTRSTVNYEEPPIILTGNPPTSAFSALKGIYKQGTDYFFNPMLAGLGKMGILMSYVDSKGCYSSVKDTLIVTMATGTIEGINTLSQYCFDGAVDTLKYVSTDPWHSGSFIGPGITNISSDKATFSPSLAGAGNHKIIFQYSDPMSTVFEISAILKVDLIGAVTINGINAGDVFCNNDPVFPIFGTYPDGVFSGPVTGNKLDPSKGIGNAIVGYTYTRASTGCSSSVNVPILINAAPKISFIPADRCIENKSDSTIFINNTTSTDDVVEWKWEFADDGKTSRLKDAVHLYANGGLQKITLTATTNKNCIATRDTTYDIGFKPVADFYWKNECFHPGNSLQLFDATVSSSFITGRQWNFNSGEAFYTAKDIVHPQTGSGYLPVEYIVKTAYPGCNDTLFKNIYIRPTYVLTGDDYFENFEDGKGGWVKDYEEVNTWTFGTPDRPVINSAASGTNAWFTGYGMSSQKIESSSVVSPCFDFTAVERPMISLKLWKRFDRNRDGATLQYKTGDSNTWEYVGTLEDGINWFNSATIKGRPGGDQMGWTTVPPDTAKWIEARHKLDELKGLKDVKFRIAYGSDGSSQENDGIAIDDIRISERTRSVLLEHFTNITNSPVDNREANELVNKVSVRNIRDVINIQYHANFPDSDPYYIDNPADVSARILFYGLIKTPYSFIDGGNTIQYANIFDYKIAKLDSNDITRRSLINPTFKIELNPVVDKGVLTLNGQVRALRNLNAENVTLYLAVTEKKNMDYSALNGEKPFYNVFRKFIPDAGGINLSKTWTKGDVYSISGMTWIMENINSSADIDVVAFIQNNLTKEMYQAGSELEKNSTVGLRDIKDEGPGFSLYPNPADKWFTVSFDENLRLETDIIIYDFKGTAVRNYSAPAGIREFKIDDTKLPAGIYLVRIKAGGIDYGFRKLMISGN